METKQSTKRLPDGLHAAYDWTDAAGEIDQLRGLTGDELSAYAEESAANARQHDQNDVSACDIVAVAAWLKPEPNGIEINLDTPNGPIVEYGSMHDADEVESSIPTGWRVDWETSAYKTSSGRLRSPLVIA